MVTWPPLKVPAFSCVVPPWMAVVVSANVPPSTFRSPDEMVRPPTVAVPLSSWKVPPLMVAVAAWRLPEDTSSSPPDTVRPVTCRLPPPVSTRVPLVTLAEPRLTEPLKPWTPAPSMTSEPDPVTEPPNSATPPVGLLMVRVLAPTVTEVVLAASLVRALMVLLAPSARVATEPPPTRPRSTPLLAASVSTGFRVMVPASI